MEREKILKQIQNLTEKSGFLVGYNEMAKDLSEVMSDDEIVQGVTAAYKKNITHFIKNGRMVRSFMAVTDKNVYLISRGRMWLNTITLLDENLKIPRDEILKIEQYELPLILKALYDAELVICTKIENYHIYVGSNFEKYLPADFLKNRVFNKVQSGIVCAECGTDNDMDARFCTKCGADLLKQMKQQINERICPNCGKEIDDGIRFCPYCGTELKEIKEEKICQNCGAKLEEDSKFCPNCGSPVELLQESKIPKCPNCGKIVTTETKFCPDCGTKIIIE